MAAVMFSGVAVHWTQFNSDLYPYSLSQPSSFRHQVAVTTNGDRVDYFFPVLLGSFPTNVNVEAIHTDQASNQVGDAVQYFRSVDGHNVRRTGSLTVMGHRLALECADFHGLVSSWREEQVTFKAGGYMWRLTASYELRFKKWRKAMLQMIASFQVH